MSVWKARHHNAAHDRALLDCAIVSDCALSGRQLAYFCQVPIRVHPRTSLCLILAAAAIASAVIAPTAAGQSERYCEKPDQAGAMLAASPAVTCQTAERVKSKLTSAACYTYARCLAEGFRCVAYWDGAFGRSFEQTSHALCSEGWRWIVWDGG